MARLNIQLIQSSLIRETAAKLRKMAVFADKPDFEEDLQLSISGTRFAFEEFRPKNGPRLSALSDATAYPQFQSRQLRKADS
jgi:hypothetical protein